MKIAICTASLGEVCPAMEHVKQCKPVGASISIFIHDDTNTLPRIDVCPRLHSKQFRMQMHKLHPGFDYYIWLDSSFEIISPNFVEFMLNQMGDKSAAFFKHYERKTILEEATYIVYNIKAGSKYLAERYEGLPLISQVDNYIQDGYSDDKLMAAGCFIYKPTKEMDSFFKDWLFNNYLWGIMDQISLPYVLWKHNINFNIIDEHILKNEYIHHHGHKSAVKHVSTYVSSAKDEDRPEKLYTNVDVVMLTCSKSSSTVKMTQAAIDTLHASEPCVRFNVTLVESIHNLPQTGPREEVAPYHGCTVICPQQPFNFNLYMTEGMKHGNAEYVLLVNNDVRFKAGWWTVMSRAMDKHKLDSASPRCPGWAYHDELIKQFQGFGTILGCRTSYTLAGWAIMTKRSTLHKIGGLNTTAPFYASDNSYSVQMRNAGLRHGLVINSIVYHELGITSRECRERGSQLFAPSNTWLNEHYPNWLVYPKDIGLE